MVVTPPKVISCSFSCECHHNSLDWIHSSSFLLFHSPRKEWIADEVPVLVAWLRVDREAMMQPRWVDKGQAAWVLEIEHDQEVHHVLWVAAHPWVVLVLWVVVQEDQQVLVVDHQWKEGDHYEASANMDQLECENFKTLELESALPLKRNAAPLSSVPMCLLCSFYWSHRLV